MRAPASFTLKQDNRTTCVLDYTQPGTSLTNENTGTPVVHTLITDRLGQLIERTTTRKDAAGATITDQQVHITYTPDGARSRLVVNGQATDYTYDEGTGLLTTLMRTHSADNAVGENGENQSGTSVLESLTYHYDTDAHLTHITNHTGAVLRAFNTVPTIVEAGTTGGAQEADASYVTDGGWATIEHRHVDGQQQSVTTYYNAEGLVIGVDDTADGLRLLTYDDAHQLTAVMTDHGTHRFTYDTAGFLIGEETTTGVVREYTYDAAGQLVRLEDSQAGVSQYVYDGLGRRVQHTDHTGAVSTYAYSPVGLLAEITGEDRDAVYLWNDALGEVAAVATGSVGTDTNGTTTCALTWDPVAFTPTVLGVNNTLVSLGALASVDAVGGRGVDPFGLSPVVAGFTTGSGVGSDADAQGLFGTLPNSIPGVPGLGLTRAGSVQVAGLEILGARAYDATTRGFMTPDPLASPVGAGWGANVYAFAGHDPVSQVDPWGLSPMTATQLHQYQAETHAAQANRRGGGVLGAIAKHAPGFELVSALGGKVQGVMDTVKTVAHASLESAKHIAKDTVNNVKDWANEHSTLVGVGLVVAGITATALLGPLGAAIVGGALLSGGFSVFTSKNADGTVNWGKVGIDSLIGGVAGGAGGALVKGIGKAGMAIHSAKSSQALFSGLQKSLQGSSMLDDAAVATAKGAQFAQKAADKSGWRFISKASDMRNAGKFARQAEGLTQQGNKLISAGDELFKVADTHLEKVKYFGDFANQKLGKALNGGLSGGIQNEYAYLSAPGDRSVAGVASSFAGGSTTGALSPVILKRKNPYTNFAADRGKDYISGVVNYASRTSPNEWDLAQANDKGVSSLEKGTAKGIGKSINKLVYPKTS